MSLWDSLDFSLDLVMFVFASGLVSSAVIGKVISIGRGGAKKETTVKSVGLRIVLAASGATILAATVWDLKRKLFLP